MKNMTLAHELKLDAAVPQLVKAALQHFPGQVILAGGAVRDAFMKKPAKDFDLFVTQSADINPIVLYLIEQLKAAGYPFDQTDTRWAWTWVIHDRLQGQVDETPPTTVIQVISCWRPTTPADVLKHFDFTVCQGAYWSGSLDDILPSHGVVGDQFYEDCKNKVLRYAGPASYGDVPPEEAVGASLLRAFKLHRRGFNLDLPSFATLMARYVEAHTPEPVLATQQSRYGREYFNLIHDRTLRTLKELDPNAFVARP